MVAALQTTLNPKVTSQGGRPQNPTRTPLLPSEPDNGLAPRRPKPREVTSRYMSTPSSSSTSTSSSSSSSNSRRCPSPMVSRTASSTHAVTPKPSAQAAAKRPQSVERRRSVTPRPHSLDLRNCNGGGSEMSAAQKLLFTSTRSLSVSFQGESFSLQVSKVKPSPSPSARKGTPERRKVSTPARDQSENSKPLDQQRWPARLRDVNCMSRSLDCTNERRTVTRSGGNVVRALQSSMVDDGTSINRRMSSVQPIVEGNSAIGSISVADHVASSDSESVSSGCTTPGAQDSDGRGGGGAIGLGQRGPRGIMVPARFWQESKSRALRQPEPCSPLSKSTGVKAFAPMKLSLDSSISSPRGVVYSRGQSSPIRGAFRPASPSKAAISSTSSPMRGMSPSRVRNLLPGTPNGSLCNTPSILSFAADPRRGKVGENRIFDAHVLRLLHNRVLQWRFVNARADAALAEQRLNAERSLYNAWITTTKLRDSVQDKRVELELMRQNMKLNFILNGQMIYLEEWSLMDRDYTSCLSGAVEALKASTLRLPVVGGARADVQNVEDAICSAVDVMQAMASSICLLSSKVGDVNSLVNELSTLTAKERALLGHCKSLLSTVAALQVNECSLRTHTLQLKHVQTLTAYV
ncbi:hypothetical protein UlMin_035364 [Ulmus minor]